MSTNNQIFPKDKLYLRFNEKELHILEYLK